MANKNLTRAKSAKNDEFYTQYRDIEHEVNAYLEYDRDVFRDKTVLLPCDDPEWSNFTKFFAQRFQDLGLKKLISTSYAPESKKFKTGYQPTLFETEAPQFNPDKTKTNGKIFILDRDITGDGRIDFNDIEWQYLEGDGDFRSDEVKRLRDEADIIVTNPPFSLFREFLAWIFEAQKQFLIIGNMNSLVYNDVFPYIRDNKMWLGKGFNAGNAYFKSLYEKDFADGVYDEKTDLVKFRNCCWLTNLDHGRRHQPLQLMTMEENLKFSKHKDIKGCDSYPRYDTFDALEVNYYDAIPSDYDGIVGVGVSFLEKHCAEQFEIVGKMSTSTVDEYNMGYPYVNGKKKFARILIRKKI